MSFPFSISTFILPLFSLDVEVTRSTPLRPFKLSSYCNTKTLEKNIESSEACYTIVETGEKKCLINGNIVTVE